MGTRCDAYQDTVFVELRLKDVLYIDVRERIRLQLSVSDGVHGMLQNLGGNDASGARPVKRVRVQQARCSEVMNPTQKVTRMTFAPKSVPYLVAVLHSTSFSPS